MTERDAVIAAAEQYLFHGLVEHDPDKVPLAPNAIRTEQGHNTGTSGEAIAKSLRSDIMNVIQGIRNVRWIVEGDQAVAWYDLDTTRTETPVLIAERFRVENGLITEIEALFHTPETELEGP